MKTSEIGCVVVVLEGGKRYDGDHEKNPAASSVIAEGETTPGLASVLVANLVTMEIGK